MSKTDVAHLFKRGEWVRFPAQSLRWRIIARCEDGSYLLAQSDVQMRTDPHPTLYRAK